MWEPASMVPGRAGPAAGPAAGVAARPGRAVALLEVVLALALFFGIAVPLLGGLSACVSAVRQSRLDARAADLAVTLLSEMQIGLVPVVDGGPTPFEEPDQDWTWQVVTAPVDVVVEGASLVRVEVVVRRPDDGYAYRLYHMLPGADDTALADVPEGGAEP